MVRRYSGLASIGLVAALLAGCGGGGGGGGSPNPPPPPPPDTTPDAFTFTAQTDTGLSAAVTSNQITIAGINAAAPVSITGGEYSIGGGAFTNAAGSVTNGQTIQVRLTTSSQFLTAANASLSVGGVSAAFSATTRDADRIPDTFAFPRRNDIARNTSISSNTVTLTGFEVPLAITITGGEYSIGGGAFTSAAGTVSSGQTLTVRLQSGAGWSRNATVRVTVGTVNVDFGVTTELPDYTPDDIAFDGTDIVYLLSGSNRVVFRWSVGESHYLDPYELSPTGVAPNRMAFSKSQRRVYLGYDSGAIRYINVVSPVAVESNFATLAAPVASISEAGNFIVAQCSGYYTCGGYVLDSSGSITATGGYYYGYSRATDFDPTTSRIYYTRDGISPNDLHYDVINQVTGLITGNGETPYHGAYNIQGPIRVSANGGYVLLGSGDIYNQAGLTWAGSLGSQVTDARWFANGSLVTLTTNTNQTLVRRLASTNLAIQEQVLYSGQALRVVGTDSRMAVVVLNGGTVRIHTYVPSDDSDGDGVTNSADAFPLDVAASVDADHDGYPDSWNTGRTEADSTTGLSLDAFPQDSACWSPAHGNGGVCNYAATMPSYTPDKVVQLGDTVYLLSNVNRRVYRWSISTGAYLNPYVVGINQGFTTIAPGQMAVSPTHQRLYLGYDTGAIRYIDLAANTGAEVQFANIAMAVSGLASVGNYVLAQDFSGAWATHYVISSGGVITDSAEWNHHSPDYAWDPVTSRVYWFSMWSPPDLNYEVIDQATGQITGNGETPYHGTYSIVPPIRVSADGQYILLGSGDVYNQNGLTWNRSLGAQFADARWLANGSLVILATSGNQTVLRRLGSNFLTSLEQVSYTGQAIRIVGNDTRMALVLVNGGNTQFQIYTPNDDSDGDGVVNTQDAFPQDRAASVDSDGDGFPDTWNPGRSQADSTTGLTLDVFPQDSACWLTAHGSGGACNYGITVPNYTPDEIQQSGDIIYLLSGANRRVYRWSISAGHYLNPYVPGLNQGFTTLSPTDIAYVASQQRLYLGYENGTIRYIDVNAATPAEVPFASVPDSVQSISSAGNFLVAQPNRYNDNGYIFSANGTLTGRGGYSSVGYSRQTAWDPNTNRLYYFRDGISPNDIHYDVIDQTTGTVTAQGESPYHSDHDVGGVIRPSPNGQTVLLGTGDMYNLSGLTWAGTLGDDIADARWLANGSVTTLTTTGNLTTLQRLGGANLSLLEQRSFTGEALRVVGSDTAMVVVAVNNGAVQFYSYVPNDDADGDGVLNTQDAFPIDRAASVDTDGDGYPDAWNAGRTQADSTTGLALDAFPQDTSCWLAAHGSGGICNYGATVPNYTPTMITHYGDVVYLLSNENRRVYRWSISTGAYLDAWIVGIHTGTSTTLPTSMAYSPTHQRLYLGYQNGQVRYLSSSAVHPVETSLANLGAAVASLGSAGNFLVANLGNGYSTFGSRVLTSGGVSVAQGGGYYYTGEYTFDSVSSRLYYAPSGYNNLAYEVIDQGTGQITSTGASNYNGPIAPYPPVRVTADGERILIGSGDIFARSGLAWAGTLGKRIADAQWRSDVLVDVDTTDLVEIRDVNTRQVLMSYQYLGQPLRVVFGTTEGYLVHVLNGTTTFTRLPFYDQDADQIPRWWEQLYANGGAGMSDTNAADATTDLDGDGINNRNEYLNHSNPLLADTDGDGLTDPQEINTWHTNPSVRDTDGDMLSDYAEVITHLTNPLDTDTDDDGYSDYIEVTYGGNPNDVSGLPQPLTSYTQGFEGGPLVTLPGWFAPVQATSPWFVTIIDGYTGAQSYRSNTTLPGQSNSAVFRGFFRPGQLSFWAKMDVGYCCNRMYVYVDGVQVLYIYSGSQWTNYTIPISLGVHDIQWKFERDSYGNAQVGEFAWIDDVVFTGQ